LETGKAVKGERVRTEKTITAKRNSALFLTIAGLMLLAAVPPAEAGKQSKKAPAEAPVVDFDKTEPMTLVVSVGHQKVDVYRGTKLVTTSAVSTGTAAHPTMIGAFSILEKQRWHHSNIYSGAPMPWMNRITWSGTALHAGVVPGYPASHGCIRLLYSFAPVLYQMSSVGDNVIVARGRPAPTPIEHPNLFQPLPPPKPCVAEKDQIAPVQPGSSPLPTFAAATSPVLLARAEVPTTVDSEAQVPASMGSAGRTEQDQSALSAMGSDPLRTHAISPISGEAPASHAVADAAGEATAVDQKPAAVAFLEAPVAVPAAAPAIVPPAAVNIVAGAAAAAIEAAVPRSKAPLRILLTRRTQRDRVIGLQEILASLGYLPKQDFDGTMGRTTIGAIKAFQKANGMAETGAFTEELVKKAYEVAGKGEPPAGHLYVRQDLSRVFDVPVSFRDADQPLGTHVYIALKFGPEDTRARWVMMNVDSDSTGPLDRIEIADDIRQKISERLTPGSTFIIADTSINSANLPKGGDFVVLAKSDPKISQSGDSAPAAKPKRRATTRYVRRYNDVPRRFFFDSPWRRPAWSSSPW
jgi:lipoprotein-anchoring transpeptidase ErfK/SrfK/peptidoglycan hydrolase-like protein with peptidoglycan-binding domain